MDMKIIKNGTLIDGTGRNPVNNTVVVIQGSKIVNIGRDGELKIPKGERAEIIEANGKTIIPGLIDIHLHMYMLGQSTDFYSLPIHNNSLDLLTRAIPSLKRSSEIGITTIRDGGSGWDWMEVALKNAINRGDIIGPRYLATGYHLTVTGGHGYFLPPWLGEFAIKEQCGMHCDGPEEWRRAST